MTRVTRKDPASAGNSLRTALCVLLTIVAVVGAAVGLGYLANHGITPHQHPTLSQH